RSTPPARTHTPPWWSLRWLFFFQAEDGIRDGHVTGVQTCALPISVVLDTIPGGRPTDFGRNIFPALLAQGQPLYGYRMSGDERRSEERRVGKECSCGWAAEGDDKGLL